MRPTLIGFAVLALALSPLRPAHAADPWPTKPVRLIVTASAGALTDTIGRFYGDKLSKAIGQPVIVDNKPGGGNVIGVQAAARAPADGYTFLLGTAASFTSNSYTFKSLPYDPLKDFVCVSWLTRPGFTVVVNAKLPIRNLQDMVAYSQTKPGGLSVAVDGPRNFTGLTAAHLGKTIGAKMTLVPYANIVQGMQDTASGITDVVVTGYGLVQGLVGRGDLRAIAVTSPQRIRGLDNVPAVSESYPGFGISGWIALFAPAGTPVEILTRVNREMERIVQEPDTKAWAETIFEPVDAHAGTLAELEEFVRSQNAMWGKMVEQMGVKPE